MQIKKKERRRSSTRSREVTRTFRKQHASTYTRACEPGSQPPVYIAFAPRPSSKSMILSGGEKVKGPGSYGFGNRMHTNAASGPGRHVARLWATLPGMLDQITRIRHDRFRGKRPECDATRRAAPAREFRDVDATRKRGPRPTLIVGRSPSAAPDEARDNDYAPYFRERAQRSHLLTMTPHACYRRYIMTPFGPLSLAYAESDSICLFICNNFVTYVQLLL